LDTVTGIGMDAGGGRAFSLTASTSSVISAALIVNSGRNFPLDGAVTRSLSISRCYEVVRIP
jgi:hypothetical protein